MIQRFAALIFTMALPFAAQAQENTAAPAGGSFKIELNAAAETDGGNCRLTYVAENHSGAALDQTEYQVAVFDAEGIVSRLLVLKFGKLVDGKTRILQFELPGTPCSAISRIVVNDNSACIDASTGKTSDICMSELQATSRTSIQFGI